MIGNKTGIIAISFFHRLDGKEQSYSALFLVIQLVRNIVTFSAAIITPVMFENNKICRRVYKLMHCIIANDVDPEFTLTNRNPNT